MGSFLIAALAVALVITAVATTVIPGVSRYITNTFPSERSAEFRSAVAVDPDAGHAAPQNGDVYETEYYVYTYYESAGGWRVEVKETWRTQYPAIFEMIYSKPVVGMHETFKGCTAMTQAPAVPKSVTDMTSAFDGCVSLKGLVYVFADPNRYDGCFAGTTQTISLLGSSTMLPELTTTSVEGNVVVK